jgi:hypothetical protein
MNGLLDDQALLLLEEKIWSAPPFCVRKAANFCTSGFKLDQRYSNLRLSLGALAGKRMAATNHVVFVVPQSTALSLFRLNDILMILQFWRHLLRSSIRTPFRRFLNQSRSQSICLDRSNPHTIFDLAHSLKNCPFSITSSAAACCLCIHVRKSNLAPHPSPPLPPPPRFSPTFQIRCDTALPLVHVR